MHDLKKILIIFQSAPYGNAKAGEGLDLCLMASTFEQTLSVLFIEDGIFLLLAEQNPKLLEDKDLSKTFKALSLYGIENIFVCQHALEKRGIVQKELIIPALILDDLQQAELLATQHSIMSF